MENKKRNKHLKSCELTFKVMLYRCLVFVFVFCLINFFITLSASYFLYKTKDPTSLIDIGSSASLFTSVFLSGFLLSKLNKQRYFLSSLTLGMIILLLTLLITVCFSKNNISVTDFIWRTLIPVFCILGGAIGVKKEKRKKIRR